MLCATLGYMGQFTTKPVHMSLRLPKTCTAELGLGLNPPSDTYLCGLSEPLLCLPPRVMQWNLYLTDEGNETGAFIYGSYVGNPV